MMNHPISVSKFLSIVKGIVSEIPVFQNVILEGEVSNFKAHSSGHFYFSLKDDTARIAAVMFRSSAQTLRFRPKDGDKVVIQGRFDVYQQTGQMQLYVTKMNLDGLGDLYIQFEALKKELSEMGLFNAEHKKPLPQYPMRIGVLCGENSAAHADITRTLKERWPLAEQIDCFSLVQGEGAPKELVHALEYLDSLALDVILIARGGGSIEDLWAFNTVELVVAIFNCKTPVIAGIGHESDTTLSDYVADYRGATPTAAATAACPHYRDVRKIIHNYDRAHLAIVTGKLNHESHALSTLQNKPYYKDPSRLFNYKWMQLDRITYSLNHHYQGFRKHSQMLKNTIDALHHTLMSRITHKKLLMQVDQDKMIQLMSNQLRQNINGYQDENNKLHQQMMTALTLKKKAFSDILKSLHHLSPLSVMLRGYSLSTKGDVVIKSISDIDVNDEMRTHVIDGTLISKIIGKEPKDD